MTDFIKKIRFSLLFIFLSLIFFHKILINPNGMLYPAADMAIYSFKEHFFVNSIKNFQTIPLWNPYMFGGQPALGSSEIPFFYPLHILFFFLPIDQTFGYLFILDIFLLGLLTYLFAKTIALNSLSASISSIIAMFSGTTILYIYPGQISILDGFVWMPLILLFCELILQKKSFHYAVLLGCSIGLMLLSGTLQISIINLLCAFSFFIFRLFFLKTKKIKLIIMLFVSVVIGTLLSAIQLIPGLEFARLSTRANGLDYSFASDFSLHPYQLITFLLPHFFGSPIVNNTYWGINGNFWSLCGYVGIFPLILSIIALLHKRNRYTIFFACAAIIFMLFSFGRFGIFYPFLYYFVPGFNFFRVPGRFLFTYGFSIAMLAGIGISTLLNKKRPKFFIYFSRSLIILFLISLSFSLFIHFNKVNFIDFLNSKGYALENNLDGIYSLIKKDIETLTLLLFLSYLLLKGAKKLLSKSVFFILAFFLILFDLWIFDFKFYATKNPKEIFINSSEINQILKDKETFRVFDLQGNSISLVGRNLIESLTGFDALYLSSYRNFLWLSGDHPDTPYESFFTFNSIRNLNILKLLNTKYILSDESNFAFDMNGVEKVTPNLYRIRETLPRAFIVPNATIAKSQKETIKLLTDPEFNPKKNIILDRNPNVPLKNPSSFTPVKIIKGNPNSLKLNPSLDAPGFLVLSEIWYPGWKAYVNNKQTEIYKTNYIFRSIYLDKGQKDIVFIFDPWTYKIGMAISIFTFIVLLFYLICYYGFRKLNKNDK